MCSKYFPSKLRSVNDAALNKAEIHGVKLLKNQTICGSCYSKLYKNISVGDNPETSGIGKIDESPKLLEMSSSQSSSTSDDNIIIPDLESFNTSILSIGSSPIKKRKLTEHTYSKKKAAEVHALIDKNIFQLSSSDENQTKSSSSTSEEIIKQLKEKFQICKTSSEKYLVLTTLPRSWSARRIEEEFGVSFHMANQAKHLQKTQGIMTSSSIKIGTTNISDDTIKLITEFYEDDDISRVCAGKRDYQIVSDNGEKIFKQRRLVLCNLKEAFHIFKQTYPDLKIGFSKFASYRPEYCILASTPGTHSICVCIYHQNIKLMFEVLKKKSALPENAQTYHDLLKKCVCEENSDQCFLLNCDSCPKIDNLFQYILQCLQTVETVSYKQWTQVDRCTMNIITKSAWEFTETFCDNISKLLPHHFIAEQQSNYLKYCKEHLNSGECIIICDFSENYSFVVQDAVQGFHWSNSQCTIHPFAIYYKDVNNELQFISIIAISESLKHNHVSVRLFWERAINYAKQKISNLSKIIHFSDGSGGQYKNRMTFFNLTQMKREFGVIAEWHFFATCHGKGSCDAMGGVIKRNAARASLQGKHITNAKDLYEWAISSDSRIHYEYFSNTDFNSMERKLRTRYKNVKAISGTHKYHGYLVQNEKSLIVKEYSFSKKYEVVQICK